MYIAPAVIFILFGSGQIQTWNELPPHDDDEPRPTVDVANVATAASHISGVKDKSNDFMSKL